MRFFVLLQCMFFCLVSCTQDKPSKSEKPSEKKTAHRDYMEDGKKIAYNTFTTLSSNLQKAMKEGGVPNAAKYCNLAASSLVDSLEQIHHVDIKRTSLKVRNQNNKPTQRELDQLNAYQKQFDAKEKLEPSLQQLEKGMAFYAPIHLMDLCQKCHGKVGETLKSEDYAIIQDLYPDDEAIDFVAGDLRGMWSITFKQ